MNLGELRDALAEFIEQAKAKLDEENEDHLKETFASLTQKIEEAVTELHESNELKDKLLEVEKTMAELKTDIFKLLDVCIAKLEQAHADVTQFKEVLDEAKESKTISEDLIEAFNEVEVPDKDEEIQALTAEKETLEDQLKEVQEKLDTYERQTRIDKRLAELTEAGLELPESIAERETNKIADMTDEEFEEYKETQLAFAALFLNEEEEETPKIHVSEAKRKMSEDNIEEQLDEEAKLFVSK